MSSFPFQSTNAEFDLHFLLSMHFVVGPNNILINIKTYFAPPNGCDHIQTNQKRC
jgi:hypothetical protein